MNLTAPRGQDRPLRCQRPRQASKSPKLRKSSISGSQLVGRVFVLVAHLTLVPDDVRRLHSAELGRVLARAHLEGLVLQNSVVSQVIAVFAHFSVELRWQNVDHLLGR